MSKLKDTPKTRVVSFSVLDRNIEQIDELLTLGIFTSRSEVLRRAIEEFYKQYKGTEDSND